MRSGWTKRQRQAENVFEVKPVPARRQSRMFPMRRKWRPVLSRANAAVIFALTISCVGCGVRSGEDPPAGADPPTAPDSLPINVVQVELRNLSAAAVDTQFYAADISSNGLPDALFIPANLIRTGIGNASTGILAPGERDLIAQPCSDTLAVGTLGGQFLDANLGSPLGQGPPRFMQARYQFDCGAVLLVEYNQTTGGYTTHIFEER